MTVVGVVVAAVAVTSGARSAARFGLAACVWLGLTGTAAATGLFANFDARPPPQLLLLAPTVLLPLFVGLSPLGARLADLPLPALVGFHVFRLPLELVMHEAAQQGIMPNQMSFEGMNFDIASGALAAVVAMLGAPRGLVVAWNVVATTLLLVIVTIAVASLPLFAAFGDRPEQLNTWVVHFPYVWLPAGLVTSATLGHVVLWRRLLGPREAANA